MEHCATQCLQFGRIAAKKFEETKDNSKACLYRPMALNKVEFLQCGGSLWGIFINIYIYMCACVCICLSMYIYIYT